MTNSAPKAVHPAFDWIRSQEISSLNLTMEEYRHKKTGAQYYHLASDNPENVFLVALRTVPMDSRGVAHILEHTALCGSERYPVRDPFFMMIRRSLNTFMNAFTSSDWTAYPFASKNRKDFSNLLDVYLDAVFFSRLDELDFSQEGHRLEFAEPDDKNSDLQYKGVVFNEMKGAMSSPTATLWQTVSKYLFPTTTYHYNSGGEPEHIPDLTHDDLKAFYKTHYHPSNAIFMTYGDIPAIEHQEVFEKLALSRFDRLDINIHVDDEKRYHAPVKVEEYYPLDDSDSSEKTHVVMAWLLGLSTDLEEMFKAQLLSSVLLDNSASPLQKVLETTTLGKSPSPVCGLEDANREMSFICGLEGCAENSTADVEKLIRNALIDIAQQGVPQEQVEAALHQLELQQREIAGDGHPYGLQLIVAGLSSAIHGGDPIKLLDIDPVLADLREKIRDPQFIPSMINDYLINNMHCLVLTLKPDSEISKRQVAAEMQKLKQIKESLTEGEAEAIIERSRLLAERQEQEDDSSILPKVGLEDVPEKVPTPKASVHRIGAEAKAPLSFYAQGTNGLCYQQVVIELPDLEPELLEVLPWYSSCLSELGVGAKSYDEVQTWQSRVTGGLNYYANIRSNVDDVQKNRSIITLSGKALQTNHEPLADLMFQTFADCRFDEGQRVQEILQQISARREHGVTAQGHRLAVALASSRMSPTAELSNRFTGLQGIKSLRALCAGFGDKKTTAELLRKFQDIHKRIQRAPRQFLLIGEENHQDELRASLEKFWSDQTAEDSTGFAGLALPETRDTVRQIWTANTQVNFCAKAFPTVPTDHPDNAPLTVLAGFMANGFLHRAIREKGGAYGGGADHDANSASFRFFSYRDPRLVDTLADFDRAVDWVITGKHEWRQVEESILGVIGGLDRPSSPAGEAKQAFYNDLFGRTEEQRLLFRKRVLDVQIEDLKRVAEDYLLPERASIGVISNSSRLEQASKLDLEEFTL